MILSSMESKIRSMFLSSLRRIEDEIDDSVIDGVEEEIEDYVILSFEVETRSMILSCFR